jgi:pyruvate dehydrogenase E2 component (dihydrolipoamide acetyltransferase)
MTEIVMPELGENISEGTITRWLKSRGDHVNEGEPLFEVSTNKVDTEIAASTTGTLVEIVASEGTTVAVGASVARISPAAEPSDADQDPAPVPHHFPVSQPDVATRRHIAPSMHHDETAADTFDLDAGSHRATLLLSPAVRHLLRKYHVDPSTVAPTGGRGRLTIHDVTAATANQAPWEERAHEGQPIRSDTYGVREASDDRAVRGTRVPLSAMRRRIGANMLHSQATSAHAWVSLEVDFVNVERVRRAAADDFREREGISLSFLPFVGRATIDALAKYSKLNATIAEDELLVHDAVHLGIAVDLDSDGLVVAVARNAERQRLRSLANEFSVLAHGARARELAIDQVTGSTFTITNVGSHGAVNAVPIINQPELAILAVGAVSSRPVVVQQVDGTEGIAIHPVGSLSLSWDHRGVDGAYAAGFLRDIKHVLETRDWSAELA